MDGTTIWSGTFTSQGVGDPVERQRVVDVWDRVLAIVDDLRFEAISAKTITLEISGLVRNNPLLWRSNRSVGIKITSSPFELARLNF